MLNKNMFFITYVCYMQVTTGNKINTTLTHWPYKVPSVYCMFTMNVNEFMREPSTYYLWRDCCVFRSFKLYNVQLFTCSKRCLCMFCWVFICANFYVNFIGIIEGRAVLKANLFIDIAVSKRMRWLRLAQHAVATQYQYCFNVCNPEFLTTPIESCIGRA